MNPPLIVTVVLNTNRRADTLEALASLAGSTHRNQRVIVLDNASTDGSVEAIRQAFPDVEVIRLEENRGYAGNNNVGIRAALERGADWVLLLNEDAVVAPDCLENLVSCDPTHPEVGITGPVVYHSSDPGIIQSAGGRLGGSNWLPVHAGQNEPDRGQYAAGREVDWVSGCAIMLRREVIEQTGLLDERFFYYWEETDWCIRARRAGWKIRFVPQAKVWHKGVQPDYRPSPNVTYYCTRNWFLLLEKHRAPLNVWAFVILWTVKALVVWTIKPDGPQAKEHRAAMWQGTRDFLRKRWGMRVVEGQPETPKKVLKPV